MRMTRQLQTINLHPVYSLMCVHSSGGFPKTTAAEEDDPLTPASESDPPTVRCVAYGTHHTDAMKTQNDEYEIVN